MESFISEILVEALGHEPGPARDTFLREHLGTDPLLCARYRSLLDEIEKGGDARIRPQDFPETRPFLLPPGAKVGPFIVKEKVGEGGFGLVYRATQETPIRREAALKVLRPGVDTLEVLRRFDLERQVLADLEHPGIARFYDAGSTAEGRPWVAMEYIGGVSLVRFCEENALDLKARLQVFRQACEAIQYAHFRGVIHRDLKPSNLLVRRSADGAIEVKVIDFGVSRALSGKAGDSDTLMTVVGQLVGTPAYMSPEQAGGRPGEVDIRSDVYAMGAILYELLTGSPVIARERISNADFSEILHLIQDHQPDRPSRRLHGRPDGGGGGSITPDQLQGDLDWIVMKALAKEKDRRYPSLADLQHDLQAYLERRPVSARPPGRRYLMTRFVQRHRAGVIAAATVLMAMVAAVLLSTSLYLKEKRSREIADRETARSEEVVRFLTNTLAAAGPAVAKGRDSTVLREILQQTKGRIDEELGNQPGIEAEMRRIVGSTLQSIGQLEEGHEEILKAVAIHRGLYSEPDEALALSLMEFADSLINLGRFKEGAIAAKEAAAMWHELAGPDDQHTVECLASYLFSQAKAAPESPDLPALVERLLVKWRENPETGGNKTIPNAVATYFKRTGKVGECIDVYLEEIEHLRSSGESASPLLVVALDNCGYMLVGAGRDEEAEPILRESLALGDRVFEGRSPHADHVWTALATIERRRGNLEKQLEYARSAGRASALAYPVGHPYWNEGHTTWGRTLLEQAEHFLELAHRERADAGAARKQREKAQTLLVELTGTEALDRYEESRQAWVVFLDRLARDRPPTELLEALEAARISLKNDPARLNEVEKWSARLQP